MYAASWCAGCSRRPYLKALGVGLGGRLDALDCPTLELPSAGWCRSPADEGWSFTTFAPIPGVRRRRLRSRGRRTVVGAVRSPAVKERDCLF
jgi:hypothetical protein